VVIYHSHTATEAYPSRTDVAYASEPFAHYVLVSTRETGNEDGPYEIRSYRIVDGVITEEEIVHQLIKPRVVHRGLQMLAQQFLRKHRLKDTSSHHRKR
jgi:hypothetical protein